MMTITMLIKDFGLRAIPLFVSDTSWDKHLSLIINWGKKNIISLCKLFHVMENLKKKNSE